MSDQNDIQNELIKRNGLSEFSVKELERNAIAYAQMQYLIEELTTSDNIVKFFTIILEKIRSFTGGIPAIIVKSKRYFEKYSIKNQQSNWVPLSQEETILFQTLALKKKKIVYLEKNKHEPINCIIDELFPKRTFSNLLILRIEEKFPTFIEIRDITFFEHIDRYAEELEEFLTPMRFSIRQAILIDNHYRLAEKTSFLLDLLFHDIRNYITTTSIAMELIDRSSDKREKIQKYVNIAKKETRGAEKLLNKVQKILLADNDKILHSVNLVDSLNEIIDVLTHSEDNCSIVISNDVSPKRVQISADELVSEIFHNLLSNSIKYYKKGDESRKQIIINWKMWEKNSSFIHITITDWGEGIPDDKKIQIFGRFQTVNHRGLGLGLNVVLRLVERYGGYIWYENRVPNDYSLGTVVNLCLRKDKK